MLTSIEFAPLHEGIDTDDVGEGDQTRPIPIKAPVMRGGWAARPSIRGGKRVLVKSLTVPTTMPAIIGEGLEKCVSDLPSGSGTMAGLEPSLNVRCNAAGADEKRVHVLPSPTSIRDAESRRVSGSVTCDSVLDPV